MRRKDREMDKEFGYEVIDKSSYGVLSTIYNSDEPYGLPLSIVRKDDILYFHSAKDGKKVHILGGTPTVWITFVNGVKVPENYTEEELIEISKDESKVGLLLSRVFTTEYESTMVRGKVQLVESENEKMEALNLICEKYTPTKSKYASMAIKSGMKRTNIYKIEIEEISSKRKKYDSEGEEMKWGRKK